MKFIFKIILFAIFFNISAVMIASTNFFPNTLYGDATTYGLDPEHPETNPTPEVMFTRLITNSNGEAATLWGVTLTFSAIMGTIALLAIGAAIATKSTTPVALGLVGVLFTVMYANSKNSFDSIMANLDSVTWYLGLMVGLGVLIMFVIALMDYASGQRSG